MEEEKEEIVLQPEEIKIAEGEIDPETGEYPDETTVEIQPEVTAPDAVFITVGELKQQLQDAIDNKAAAEAGFLEAIKFHDSEIARLQSLLDKI